MIQDIDETDQEAQVRQTIVKELNKQVEISEDLHIKLADKVNKNGVKYLFVTIYKRLAKRLVDKRT